MGAATITVPSNQFLATPSKEKVVLTASDDDYYDSVKFKLLLAAKGSIMENDKRNFCSHVPVSHDCRPGHRLH